MYFLLSATALASILFSTTTMAHMEMTKPYPIRSKNNPANTASGKVDYSMTAPLQASGADYPCKGYQNDPVQVVATYQAGSTQELEIGGSASHGGGSCQVSLSYDNGKTFSVIKSMIGGCPLTTKYDFQIPSYAPNGTALLSWSWQNEIGNREFYQNCAWVDVVSSAPKMTRRSNPGKQRRDTFNKWSDLPGIWKANLKSVTSCTTTEGQDPVYPHPGPDVVYGHGLSSSSPASPGDCDGGSSGGSSGGSASPAPSSSSAAAPIQTQTQTQAPSKAPITVVPVSPTYAPQPPAEAPSSKTSSSASAAPTAPVSAPAPSGGSLAYGSKSTMSQFLPCNPGSFLCTSETSFAQCVGGNSYVSMGSVAPGMKCLPSTDGKFRDDKYVAA